LLNLIYFCHAASTPSRYYLLGSEEKINLTVKLSNEGEDSYITSVNISLPQDVSYVHVVLDKDECLPISCQQVSYSAYSYFSYFIKNF